MNEKERREEAIRLLRDNDPVFLPPDKHYSYICPVCGNGSGVDGTGLAYNPKNKNWKCFKCAGKDEKGGAYDTLDLFMLHNGITEFNEGLNRACQYFHINYRYDPEAKDKTHTAEPVKQNRSEQTPADEPPRTEKKPADNSTGEAETQRENKGNNRTETATSTEVIITKTETDYTDYYTEANSHISDTDYHRGISLCTLNRFNIGYDASWKHPNPKDPNKAKYVPASPRLIIPTSKTSYLARSTDPNCDKKYQKMKVGEVHIFNSDALYEADKPIFVVEGELDALSVIDCGGYAVGLGSIANIGALLKLIKEKRPAQPLVLALDNDEDGQTATKTLDNKLTELDIPHYEYSISGEHKDANGLFMADKDGLYNNILNGENYTREKAVEEYKAKYSTTSSLKKFIDNLIASRDNSEISTGFSNLDKYLNGGFRPALHIIGAVSSLGKTTFCLQIANHIAQCGHDVLFFSLEMSHDELTAKTISRYTYQLTVENGGDIHNAKTTLGVMDGKRFFGDCEDLKENYTEAEKNLIKDAMKEYSKYSDHLFVREGIGDISVTSIIDAVKEHKKITGTTPVVFLDYLQVLSPVNDRWSDKQNIDKAVLELKRLSRDYMTPVIAISSFNRDNYDKSAGMQAYKESGSIEYSADILIALQMSGAGRRDFDIDVAKTKDPREVECVILKNRNGQTTKKDICFKYHPKFNFYEEWDGAFTFDTEII